LQHLVQLFDVHRVDKADSTILVSAFFAFASTCLSLSTVDALARDYPLWTPFFFWT
jgi:hypothetical protein